MQDNNQKEYCGLSELLSIDKYMPKYNSYIMELCSDLTKNKNKVVDFGAGIGTLSLIYKDLYKKEPICVEIDEKNIKLLEDKGLKVFEKITDIPEHIDLVFSSNVFEHIKDDEGLYDSDADRSNPIGCACVGSQFHQIWFIDNTFLVTPLPVYVCVCRAAP